MKAAERAEALSADISPYHRQPRHAQPDRAAAMRSLPHLDLHRKDASSESPMFRAPIAQANQLACVSGDFF